MKISIITVCFNSRSTIEDTILSIAAQNHRDVEYIIIDGGSTDGTVELIKKHADKIVKWVSEPDKGIYDAMNKGIKLASGEIIGTLNADDVYANEHVIDQIAAVFNDPSVDACYGDLVYVKKLNLNKIVRFWSAGPYFPRAFSTGWCPPHPTFFVRRNIYEKHGRFDLDFSLAADFELMLRFIEKKLVNTVYIPSVLVKMRLGGATNRSLRNIIAQNKEIIRAFKINIIDLSTPTFFVKKLCTRLKQFFPGLYR